MWKILLKIYGLSTFTVFSWVAEKIILEEMKNIEKQPSVFNNVEDDYLKY